MQITCFMGSESTKLSLKTTSHVMSQKYSSLIPLYLLSMLPHANDSYTSHVKNQHTHSSFDYFHIPYKTK